MKGFSLAMRSIVQPVRMRPHGSADWAMLTQNGKDWATVNQRATNQTSPNAIALHPSQAVRFKRIIPKANPTDHSTVFF
jgi:hypothetical protein